MSQKKYKKIHTGSIPSKHSFSLTKQKMIFATKAPLTQKPKTVKFETLLHCESEIQTHTCMHRYTHGHTSKWTHTHTHTHTHTETHQQPYNLSARTMRTNMRYVLEGMSFIIVKSRVRGSTQCRNLRAVAMVFEHSRRCYSNKARVSKSHRSDLMSCLTYFEYSSNVTRLR